LHETNKHVDLRSDIRKKAKAHGFDVCHFTRPTIKQRDKTALDAWLKDGYQADMAWMKESIRLERRKHPESMLDDVQTVICLAMRHCPPAYDLESSQQSKEQGVIASYAYGLDYHDVMKKRLKMLARELDDMLGEHGQRIYVDTAPVLEHSLAASAGLGWQGKHSLTIHQTYGSYMMLGEIFTTALIETDEEASLHCGSCTACLDTCPTGAIVAPYVVDANRCISYLTIEYRGVIARELRPQMGNHIYGCDDCQMVCPWHRKMDDLKDDALNVNPWRVLPSLSELLALSEDDFREKFRKSPIKRTGRIALLRNVCIAIGNSGSSHFIEQLLPFCQHDEAVLRVHAIWAVAQLMNQAACLQLLTELQEHETHADVLQEIAQCRHEAIASAA